VPFVTQVPISRSNPIYVYIFYTEDASAVDFGAAVTALGLYLESKGLAYRPGHRVARSFYWFLLSHPLQIPT